ncbi:WD repeat-containing protein 86 [Pyrus ussuriensis x Pyrus communis]|uniref:WD repeat-containing protein 86 n=1 Tax=Pyrus ussuriensis x Pyrus communis TaxID=2448454 RepID=A0A5N5FR51_9ROSA|nr:WD repeat-containing protein 86 [Pyrus ussuriensis x Pyrus communis]
MSNEDALNALVVSNDGTVYIWSMDCQIWVWSKPFGEDGEDGNRVGSGLGGFGFEFGEDKERGEERVRWRKVGNGGPVGRVLGMQVHEDAVNTLAVLNDGTVYTESTDCQIWVWSKSFGKDGEDGCGVGSGLGGSGFELEENGEQGEENVRGRKVGEGGRMGRVWGCRYPERGERERGEKEGGSHNFI